MSTSEAGFWKEYRDNGDLAVAVLDALREVAEESAPLCWEPVETEPVVRWLADRPSLAEHVAGYVPVLEVHPASVTPRPVLPVSALEPLASRLGRAGRDAGLFTETASVDPGSDTNSAWANSCGDTTRAWDQVTRGPCGVAVDRDGSVIAFKPLARDTLGALVSKPYLAAELQPMLRLGHEVPAAGVTEFAPAGGLGPITQVMEGDPADVGHRHSSGMRMSTSGPVHTTADAKVTAAALPAAIPEIARELAARILAELRTRR